jgi:hypothetical protein
MQRISNRVWWSGVAILCSLILASGGFSQRSKNTQQSVSLPVSDVVRARNLEIVDKNGFARIRMSAEDNGIVTISVIRPDMPTPVLQFFDMPVDDSPTQSGQSIESTATAAQKKKHWDTELKFWNETGKSVSYFAISNFGKNGEWGISMFAAKDAVGRKGDAITTRILPGTIKHQTDRLEARKP